MNLADALAWAASPLLCSLKQLCPNVQLYEEAGCAYLRPGRRANSGSIRRVTKPLLATSAKPTRRSTLRMVTASGVTGESGRWSPDAEDAAISCHISVPKSLASGGDPNRRTPGPAPTRAGPRRRFRTGRRPVAAASPLTRAARRSPLSHIVTESRPQSSRPYITGSQRRMSPPSVASADRRHRSALQRRGQRPDRQAARLGLSRRHRHDYTGRFTSITYNDAPGGRPGSARSLSPDLRRGAGTHRGSARRATRSPSRPWPTVPSS